MANTQTTVPLFVANQVLTAAQQNASAGTGVPVFATTVTRDAAFGGSNKALAEGQLCYLESTDNTQYYNGTSWIALGGGTGKVLQVVQTVYSTQTVTSSTTYVTTGQTATITPSSTASKILVICNFGGYSLASYSTTWTLFRGTVAGTDLAAGAAGMSTMAYSAVTGNSQVAMTYLDSPSTAAAQVYTAGMKVSNALATGAAQIGNTTGTMTLIEVTA